MSLHSQPAASQEKRAKVRISNAGLTITALPLLAARDWGTFKEHGLDVEIVVMSPPLGAAAMNQGDIDYVAGVGPASVSATLTGLQSRAIWFSSDRISYWLQSTPQFKTLQELKGKKIALSGGVGGTNHVALSIAMEKSAVNPKDYVMVGIPGQQIQILYSLETGFVEAALMSPPHIFAAARKGFYKLLDVGAMVEMPGGGLTAMVRTVQERPAEVRRVIRALQVAKDEVRKSKPRTVELIMRLLKMDKDGAAETYDAFQTTLNPTGIPNRAGIDNLVRSLQPRAASPTERSPLAKSPTIASRPKSRRSWDTNCLNCEGNVDFISLRRTRSWPGRGLRIEDRGWQTLLAIYDPLSSIINHLHAHRNDKL